MTNKKGICLILGIMCFALTAGICIKSTNTAVTQSYTENNLRAEVLKYKEKYDNKIKDIEKINEELETEIAKATTNNSELEETKNQITDGNKMLGLTDVKGPGVIINVSDSKLDTGNSLLSSELLVHDKDILGIVNELKNAGAEAISINGQRVVSTTAIICGGKNRFTVCNSSNRLTRNTSKFRQARGIFKTFKRKRTRSRFRQIK